MLAFTLTTGAYLRSKLRHWLQQGPKMLLCLRATRASWRASFQAPNSFLFPALGIVRSGRLRRKFAVS